MDLEAPGDDVAQQAKRLHAGGRRGAAAEEGETLGAVFAPGFELVKQPALADAGFGDHRHCSHRALGEEAVVGGLQRFEFGVAADHPGGHAFDAACADTELAGFGALDQVALHRGVDPLDGQRLLRVHLEQAAHLGVCVVRYPQGAGRGGLLHAGCDIDRMAADVAFGVHAAAQQHAAGVDAYADVEAGVAVTGQDFCAKGSAQLQQRQAAVHGALGVVFAGFVYTEGGQDVVASVLQHFAAVGNNHGRAACKRIVHHGADGLRVQLLAEVGGADHVQEQDAHLLESLGGFDRSCRRGDQCGEPGLQWRHRHVHHCIAKQRTLGFKRLDPGFELLLFR